MDYQNNNGDAYESNVAKKRHSPAELKASKRDSVDRTKSEENDIALPEPTFRQVPVNVTRRTDSPVVPMPPPRNTKASEAKPRRRIPNKKQKRRIDGGNGSDSDSDRDELNRTSDHDGVIILPKKVPNENQGDGQWNAALLEEENERLRQHRMLKKRNEAFIEISQRRQPIMRNSKMIIGRFLNFRYYFLEYALPPLNQVVICHQENLQNYLEENISGNKNGGPSTFSEDRTPLTMDGIIDDVEAGVVKLYSLKFGKPESIDEHRFSQMLEVIAGLERHVISRFRGRPGSYHKHERLLEELLHPHALQESSQCENYGFIDTMIDLMVDQYWEKIMTAAIDVAKSHRTQRTEDDRNWKQVIEESRQDGRLSSSYVDWVTAGIDSSMLKDVQAKYLRRKVTPDQFRDTTDSQEFCPNLMAPRTVSLVLAKGHIVTRIKEVSEDDLASFGWYRESLSHPLWRCQPVGDGRDIVKMDVDGKFLGLFALKPGRSDWHDWVLIEPNDESPKEPRARPISESEADVLGLRGQERPKLPKGWLSSWP